MTATLSPFLPLMIQLPTTHSPTRKRPRHAVEEQTTIRTMDDFLQQLRISFEDPLRIDKLVDYSRQLHQEYTDRLKESGNSMLPSYNHTLPTGKETGDCLALDVGGSTFRIALIRLAGRDLGSKSMSISQTRSYEICADIKKLEGQAFFDWMADRIAEMLAECAVPMTIELPMGLAWSFPIEQTSSRSGLLLPMGKNFRAVEGLLKQDLSEIIMVSCRKRKLNVRMRAIVNDSAATLLSQAYLDSAARMSLILGTGMNSAVFLPVACVATEKFGDRPLSWTSTATHVLVNTELSMFGKGIMPVTRWDEHLNKNHLRPNFQPMEYLATGMYLGEIVRLVLVEAIETAGLFGGEYPSNFSKPYDLQTKTAAAFEEDNNLDLAKAWSTFTAAHPINVHPSQADLLFVRAVVQCVARRAQAYLATALHALWSLRTASEDVSNNEDHITVACNGAVIEHYPAFRSRCQSYLDQLCKACGVAEKTIILEMSPESSIFGAAVAVACLKDS